MFVGNNIIILLLMLLPAGQGRQLQYLSSFNYGDMSFSSDEAIIEDYVTLNSDPKARHISDVNTMFYYSTLSYGLLMVTNRSFSTIFSQYY